MMGLRVPDDYMTGASPNDPTKMTGPFTAEEPLAQQIHRTWNQINTAGNPARPGSRSALRTKLQGTEGQTEDRPRPHIDTCEAENEGDSSSSTARPRLPRQDTGAFGREDKHGKTNLLNPTEDEPVERDSNGMSLRASGRRIFRRSVSGDGTEGEQKDKLDNRLRRRRTLQGLKQETNPIDEIREESGVPTEQSADESLEPLGRRATPPKNSPSVEKNEEKTDRGNEQNCQFVRFQEKCEYVGEDEPKEDQQPEAYQMLKVKFDERFKKLHQKRQTRLKNHQDIMKQDHLRKQFNALPVAEVHNITNVFHRFDIDGSGTLSASEAMSALRELGLQGSNLAEKREAQNVCRNPSGLDGGEDDDRQISLMEFALHIVPRVRQALADMQSNEMVRYFCLFDKQGTGKLRPEHCMEIGKHLKLDTLVLRHFIDEKHKKRPNSIDIGEFKLIIAMCKEHNERLVRLNEVKIKKDSGISDALFAEFRPDIVNLWALFNRYDKDGSGELSEHEIIGVFREFGLMPHTTQERKEIEYFVAATDLNKDHSFCFAEFLLMTKKVRQSAMEQQRQHNFAAFAKYDRNGDQELSFKELCALLTDVGVQPRTREEQQELAALIQNTDEDASGFINFQEFEVLVQRINERLKSIRFQEEIDYGLRIGLSESQLYDFRFAFESLDLDGSGKLDFSEVRQCLLMLGKKVSHETLETAFKILDEDGSGELDFTEFLEFIKLLRDGEGIFTDEPNLCSPNVKFLDLTVLRRVIEIFGLSKIYINSLSKTETMDLFCFFFELRDDDNIHDTLKIRSVSELYDVAKAKANSKCSK